MTINKHVLTLCFLLCPMIHCRAQDLIIRKAGDTVRVKILDVSPGEVKYMKPEQANGSSYILLKSAIKQINYSNGVVDSFVIVPQLNTNTPALLPGAGDLYQDGKKDAKTYYHRYKGAGTGTLITSMLSPLVGLLPATMCSITDPDDAHLSCLKPELMKNKTYAKGYMHQAKRIKAGKVWMNWAVGLGLNVFLLTMISIGHK